MGVDVDLLGGVFMGLRAYNSEIYDAYFTGIEGEVDFYVEEAMDCGGPVLELGCGTGRVLLPIARSGIEITGLDIDHDLLNLLRRKLVQEEKEVADRVRVFEADMIAFHSDERYSIAIAPYRAFQHLLTSIDQRKALDCIHRHLESGGRFVFNAYDPLEEIAREGFALPLRKDCDFIDPSTGHTVVVYFSRHYDPELQILEQEFTFEEFDLNGESKRRWGNLLSLRWTPHGEMVHLLERSGFRVDALYGDFTGEQYVGYGEQVWVVTKI